MVMFLFKKKWKELFDVLSADFDDINAFHTVTKDFKTVYIRMFKCFLLYYKRKCHENDVINDDKFVAERITGEDVNMKKSASNYVMEHDLEEPTPGGDYESLSICPPHGENDAYLFHYSNVLLIDMDRNEMSYHMWRSSCVTSLWQSHDEHCTRWLRKVMNPTTIGTLQVVWNDNNL
jgi:hypothetical protein